MGPILTLDGLVDIVHALTLVVFGVLVVHRFIRRRTPDRDFDVPLWLVFCLLLQPVRHFLEPYISDGTSIAISTATVVILVFGFIGQKGKYRRLRPPVSKVS